jgi:hypothetical protein
MVHEYSHGYNFVLAAKNADSPLLNLSSPMQVPLTEGQAFWREWEFWMGGAACFGESNLSRQQSDYLTLYGDTPLNQSRAIRAAQLETYIWRVVRYVRALCDVQVNMGWRTFVDWRVLHLSGHTRVRTSIRYRWYSIWKYATGSNGTWDDTEEVRYGSFGHGLLSLDLVCPAAQSIVDRLFSIGGSRKKRLTWLLLG